jgi:hypothetical protein
MHEIPTTENQIKKTAGIENNQELAEAYITEFDEEMPDIKMGKISKLIKKISGGLINSQRQVNYILIGLFILFIIGSILVITKHGDPKADIISSEPPPGYGMPVRGANAR